MPRMLPLAALLIGTLASPVAADPAVGFGLNVIFSGARTDTGVGLRLFSRDQQNSGAGSVGVDYVLRDQRFRVTLGAAYLTDRGYVELNGGLDLAGDGFDLGLGGGWGLGGDWGGTQERNALGQNTLQSPVSPLAQ